MFNKVGLIITSAGGSGVKQTVKLLKSNFFYWGVPQIYNYGITTMKMGGNYCDYKHKDKINFQIEFYSFNEYTEFSIEDAESDSSNHYTMEYRRHTKPFKRSIISNDNFFYGQYYEYIFSVELKTKCN